MEFSLTFVITSYSIHYTKLYDFQQHESGFTLGGPVVIPGVYDGRDRTFFFGSLGVFVSRQGASGNLMTVPTALMQTGDFSELSTPINDPETGLPFSYNFV